jgi:hypothetical protein
MAPPNETGLTIGHIDLNGIFNAWLTDPPGV